MNTKAQRMDQFTPHFFATLSGQVETLQKEGKDIIRLDEGSPDLPPPPEVVQALMRTADLAGAHSYQPHRGKLELRQAWANMYARVHGVDLDPEREIVPLLGSKEGIFHFPLAFVNPGDVVLIPDPGYITYTRGALMAGGEPYFMPLLPENDYLPDFGAISPDILRRAKIMWLNYPNNPTSACAPLEFFREAVNFAQRQRLILCHDAAYVQVNFDGYHPASILEVPEAREVAVEFNSLSKSHNMAGWRVGALMGNPDVLKVFYTLKTNVDSGHFLPVLEASVDAMNGNQAWIAERNAILQSRRDALLEGLHSLGLAPRTPQASLYIWTPIPRGWTSMEFASYVLLEAGVSLTPGIIFGASGEGYVRISITAPEERIQQAVRRMSSMRWEAR